MVQCAPIVMEISRDYLCYSWGLGTYICSERQLNSSWKGQPTSVCLLDIEEHQRNCQDA